MVCNSGSTATRLEGREERDGWCVTRVVRIHGWWDGGIGTGGVLLGWYGYTIGGTGGGTDTRLVGRVERDGWCVTRIVRIHGWRAAPNGMFRTEGETWVK